MVKRETANTFFLICVCVLIILGPLLSVAARSTIPQEKKGELLVGAVAVTTDSNYNNKDKPNPEVWMIETTSNKLGEIVQVHENGTLHITAKDCVVIYNKDKWKKVKITTWAENKNGI